MNGRSPIVWIRLPAIGATKNSVAVQGRSFSPASSGPFRWAVCRNCAMKYTVPNSDAVMKKVAALPDENARDRNRCMGSIGALARSSQATNATRAAARR